jgi:hypothetical protein
MVKKKQCDEKEVENCEILPNKNLVGQEWNRTERTKDEERKAKRHMIVLYIGTATYCCYCGAVNKDIRTALHGALACLTLGCVWRPKEGTRFVYDKY